MPANTPASAHLGSQVTRPSLPAFQVLKSIPHYLNLSACLFTVISPHQNVSSSRVGTVLALLTVYPQGLMQGRAQSRSSSTLI